MASQTEWRLVAPTIDNRHPRWSAYVGVPAVIGPDEPRGGPTRGGPPSAYVQAGRPPGGIVLTGPWAEIRPRPLGRWRLRQPSDLLGCSAELGGALWAKTEPPALSHHSPTGCNPAILRKPYTCHVSAHATRRHPLRLRRGFGVATPSLEGSCAMLSSSLLPPWQRADRIDDAGRPCDGRGGHCARAAGRPAGPGRPMRRAGRS